MGWEQIINIRGEHGKHAELRPTATHIQWRQTDGEVGGPWIDLVALTDITGPPGADGAEGEDGRTVELRATDTHVQWRNVGDTVWADLVALEAITGPPGDGADVTWDSLAGRPDEFPPEPHTHPRAGVDGLDDALTAMAAALAEKADHDDPRLTDSRTPTAGSVTNATVAADAGISADKLADGVTSKVLTAAERQRLAGVATGATANASDAALRDRATHTGTQQAATISDFVSAVSAIVQTAIGAAPEALDTLAEIAEALNNDPDFAATMTTALAGKEPTVPNGTTGQFYRGDKAWVALTKATVGLSNVDNTTDAAKPVSTAQAAAIDTRVPATRTVAGKALSADVTLAKGDVGLGNVNNTADADKPVSTAQAAAIATRAPLDHDHTIGDVTGLQDTLDTIGDAPSFRVYETFADAPPLPVDTVVISRTGL